MWSIARAPLSVVSQKVDVFLRVVALLMTVETDELTLRQTNIHVCLFMACACMRVYVVRLRVMTEFCQEYMKGVDSFLASPQFDAVVERVSLLSSYTKHFRFKKSGRKKTQKVLIPKIPKLVEELEELMSPFEDVGAPLKKVAEMISSVYSIGWSLLFP